ncbi:MAG: hypothetical protein HZB36_04505 [Candidatus Omnitrophica bacterium]|nr:hypothetical protein [Candidatus Omnitrophota bacterium]
MKRIAISGLIFVFLAGFTTLGFCWPWDKNAAEVTKSAPAIAAPEAAAKQAPVAQEVPKEAVRPSKANIDKDRMLREKKKSALNNSQWDIEVVALSGKGSKQKDALVFYENKFSSGEFSKSGFDASNYTLTLQENGNAVVETMQTSEKEGIIFWRIELDPAVTICKGVLSRQLPNNKSEDYSFVSVAKKPYQPPAPAPASPAIEEAAVPKAKK